MNSGLQIDLLPPFAARIRCQKLTQLPSPDVFREIQEAFSKHPVVVFSSQDITDREQIEFSKMFGPQEPIESYGRKAKPRLEGEIADLSNLDENGELWRENSIKRMFNLGNLLWHTDSSFKHVPALCSMLSSRSEPPPVGGQTEFTDLRAVYEALPEATRRKIDDLVVVHDITRSRELIGYTDMDPVIAERLPPVRQRLVRKHPSSGRKTLYLASHASSIVGWSREEGRALISELMSFATQPEFVYRHEWTLHDLVMWDNRCTMHRGIAYDDLKYKREMHRTTVSEHANTLDQI